MIIRNLVIYNSRYEIDKVDNFSTYVKLGNQKDDICDYYLHFIEGSSTFKSIIKIFIITLIIIFFWKSKFIIFGAQDRLSILALRFIQIANRPYTVVPSNFEFFRRPTVHSHRILSIRKNAEFVDGRYFYDLPPKTKIDFSCAVWKRKVKLQGKKRVFISQPYYLDHNIDLNLWVESVRKTCEENNIRHIKFHPRDTLEYRSLVLANGIKSTAFPSYKCVGIFSQLLIQAKASGAEVMFVDEYFDSYFSDDYLAFKKNVLCNLV